MLQRVAGRSVVVVGATATYGSALLWDAAMWGRTRGTKFLRLLHACWFSAHDRSPTYLPPPDLNKEGTTVNSQYQHLPGAPATDSYLLSATCASLPLGHEPDLGGVCVWY